MESELCLKLALDFLVVEFLSELQQKVVASVAPFAVIVVPIAASKVVFYKMAVLD